MTIDIAKIASILGGERVLHRRVGSLADLEQVVAAGLPLRALDAAVRYVAGNGRAATALKDGLVPRATRSRRTRLKLGESERVERLARTMALAEEVWENREDAVAFLNEPHPMLEEKAPLDMAATELGARRVEQLLTQMEYGLPV
jgi:putative toxin-antitoxin system antitoxin component (TIGR02293 family)